jgi:hypothetical protein
MKPPLRAPRAGGQAELDLIIAKQPPDMVELVKAVLAKLRPRFPGAVEMVYDKKRGMVLGFCPDERASNVINSIAVYSKWINLFFFEGDTLPDPEGLLQGEGTMVRHIRLTSADDLDRPAIKALMAEALKRAHPKLNPKAKRQVLIKQRS